MRSQMKTWLGQGYTQASSFRQKEYTLPVGHTFRRIATKAETTFGPSTYAVHSKEDFNRYVTAFRKEKGPASIFHEVTFKSKEEIKIPSMTKRLEVLRKVMGGDSVSEKTVLNQYHAISGGKWNGPMEESFIKALVSQGYHAIIDDMDAGVVGESPLVIFKPEAFGKKVSTLLTGEAIKLAEVSLKEINNRKT